MSVTERTFEQVALEEPDRRWELHRGRMREKPGMSFAHGWVMHELAAQLIRQLDPARFQLRLNHGRTRRLDQTNYIPDIVVVPTPLAAAGLAARPRALEVYDDPLPLVVEVWSPSTGEYDVDEKLPEYLQRGDVEIWRVHPDERTLTAWRRRPDGGYDEATLTGGLVRPLALAGAVIDLDTRFAF